MRRIGAAVIDCSIMVIGFILIIGYGTDYIAGNREVRLTLHMGIALYMFYNFICDIIFSGTTIGKYIMKLRLQREGKGEKISVPFAIGHTLVKQLFLMLGWISIIVYIVNHYRMPYDKWLDMSICKIEDDEM